MLYLAAATSGGLIVLFVELVLGYWRGRKTPPGSTNGAKSGIAETRLEELEDKYARLDRRFTRMQGEFSALTRLEADDDDGERGGNGR